MKKNNTARCKEIQTKADKIEALLSNPKSSKALLYALRALLIELSNESKINVDTPTIAGTFYILAATSEADYSVHIFEMCLRHIDVLLSKPDHKTAKKIANFWDAPGPNYHRIDPFPARKAKGGSNHATN